MACTCTQFSSPWTFTPWVCPWSWCHMLCTGWSYFHHRAKVMWCSLWSAVMSVKPPYDAKHVSVCVTSIAWPEQPGQSPWSELCPWQVAFPGAWKLSPKYIASRRHGVRSATSGGMGSPPHQRLSLPLSSISLYGSLSSESHLSSVKIKLVKTSSCASVTNPNVSAGKRKCCIHSASQRRASGPRYLIKHLSVLMEGHFNF